MREQYIRKLQKEIEKLKEEKNAVLLVHNYQRPEIQEIADYLGDSLELAKKAKETKADIIVFCGVDFMAETASILNPDKKVIIPTLEARCPMAAQLPAKLVKKTKEANPEAPFITYVNTLAEAKAEADVCCTSANAPQIASALKRNPVLMGPDRNLAWFTEKETGVKVIPVPQNGYCYVHKKFDAADIMFLKEEHPGAVVVVHPECDPEVQRLADFVGSTSQMVKFAHETDAEKIIVGTEIGLIDRLRRELPEKTFIPANKEAICIQMKENTLEKVRDALLYEKHVVKVPEEIAKKAERSIIRMFELMK
ncbi:MAG: quinolinate synthase NadA [Candidatus Baldrarchaeia archaeon]